MSSVAEGLSLWFVLETFILLWSTIHQRRFRGGEGKVSSYTAVSFRCKPNNRLPLLFFQITKEIIKIIMLTFSSLNLLTSIFLLLPKLCRKNRMTTLSQKYSFLFAHLSLTMRLKLSNSCFSLTKHNLKTRNWTLRNNKWVYLFFSCFKHVLNSRYAHKSYIDLELLRFRLSRVTHSKSSTRLNCKVLKFIW